MHRHGPASYAATPSIPSGRACIWAGGRGRSWPTASGPSSTTSPPTPPDRSGSLAGSRGSPRPSPPTGRMSGPILHEESAEEVLVGGPHDLLTNRTSAEPARVDASHH